MYEASVINSVMGCGLLSVPVKNLLRAASQQNNRLLDPPE
jgi:hypothetical protein